IVHLGAEVYAKVDASEGLKLLAEEEGELNKAINEVAKRLSEVESLQSQYESVIQQALAAAQARQGAQGK
ncbi:MAG: prefoldin subunit alpha, partial [Acidilobus sp.]